MNKIALVLVVIMYAGLISNEYKYGLSISVDGPNEIAYMLGRWLSPFVVVGIPLLLFRLAQYITSKIQDAATPPIRGGSVAEMYGAISENSSELRR